MSQRKGKYLSEKPSGKPGRRRRNRLPLILSAVLILLTLTALVLGFTVGGDDLKGQWLYGSTVYSFNGKGKGTMELTDEAYSYTYEFSEDSLTIDFADDRLSDPSYRVALKEDVLTLEGSGDLAGVTYELLRIEK